MKKKTRTYILIICCIFLVILTISFKSASSEKESLNPRAKVWEGEITIVRTGFENSEASDQSVSELRNMSSKGTLSEELSIKVCGMSSTMYIKEVSHNLCDESEGENSIQYTQAKCLYPYPKETKKPGSYSHLKIMSSAEIYQGNDAPSQKEMTRVVLYFPDSEHFKIEVHNSFYRDFFMETVSRYFFACSGNTTVEISTRRTGSIGQKEEGSYRKTGEGFTRETISPPEEIPCEYTFKGPVTGDSFFGSEEIDRIDFPSYEPVGYKGWNTSQASYSKTTVVTWNFTSRDVCPEVLDRLLVDLAYCEAYLDKGIQDFARTIKEYEALVHDLAYEILMGQPPPSRNIPPSEDDEDEGEMGVDPKTCQMENEDEFLESVRQQCLPKIIFDSVKAHEYTHLQQCLEFYEEMNEGDPHIKGLMEAAAYIDGARVLLDWLEENCPNTETESLEERLEKLEETKFRRYE